jgi:hypothetical protein
MGDAYERWLEILRQANTVQSNHPSRLPGWLQTEATTRAIFAHTDRSPEWIDQMVAHRLSLREQVFAEAGFRLHQVLLWEPALEFPLRADTDQLEQLGLLLEAITAGVQIRILPSAAADSNGLMGHISLAVLPSNTLLYIEHADASGEVVPGPLTIEPISEQYAVTWDDHALTADETLAALRARLLPR